VDPTDNVTFLGAVRPIDGVNVWPAMLASVLEREPGQPPVEYLHEYLPTTQSSLIWQEKWKLITGAGSVNWCEL